MPNDNHPSRGSSVIDLKRPATRTGIVVGGYVLAFAIATIGTRAYIAATSNIDRQGEAGMSAFGDSFFFLVVLGLASVPATGAALYFLRSSAGFWRVLSIGSFAIACTAVAAFVLSALARLPGVGVHAQSWAMISPLRILVAPLLALFFLLSALLAPTRVARWWLIAAGGAELVSFVCVALMWWWSAR